MKPVFVKANEKVSLVVKISDDKMKLFLDAEPIPVEEPPVDAEAKVEEKKPDVKPAAGKTPAKKKESARKNAVYQPVTASEIQNLLSEFIQLDDFHRPVLADVAAVISRGEKVEERRIGRGEEPQEGTGGKVVFLVKKFTGHGEVEVNEKGRVNFHELKMFDNITKGMLVGRIYPPKNGVDGKDALGKVISARPGKPAKITVDRTLSIKNADRAEESYQVIEALADGYLADDNGRLCIKEELSVSGDLDYRIGSINFIGKVKVTGDVLPGFSIKAKKDIEISGSVREATLVSENGSVSVRGYVFGGQDVHIVAAGDFSCRVAQELEAECGGNMTIEKEAMDCRLRSQSALYSEKGVLAGGQTLTVCGVQVRELGQASGKETKVGICSDVEMTREYVEIVRQIELHEKASLLAKMHLGPFAEHPERIERLAPGHRDKMKILNEKRKKIEASKAKLFEKKDELLRRAHSNKVSRVNVLGTLFEGVTISVGADRFVQKGNSKGPLSVDYIPEEKVFKSGELKPLECTVERGKPATGEDKNG